jgi:hypothetical protein
MKFSKNPYYPSSTKELHERIIKEGKEKLRVLTKMRG